MKVKDLKDILCKDHGLIDVVSESIDEEFAIACTSAYIVDEYGEETIVDMYPDFNPTFGAALVLVIA